MGAVTALLLGLLLTGPALGRTVEFVHAVEIPPEAEGGDLAIWMPLAGHMAGQAVTAREVRATLPGLIRLERRHGNLFWAGRTGHRPGDPVRVEVRYRIERHPLHPGGADKAPPGGFVHSGPAMPADHPGVEALLAKVELHDPSPIGRVRALYDFVIDYMRDERTGNGWGRADGLWAVRYGHGDHSDFAALFVTLARAWQIPARLRFGVQLPVGSRGGRVAPHTWAEFHLEGVGWLPVDPSAAKHNGDRDAYFGRLPADRLALWTGRGAGLSGAENPPGFLLYPHVELNGRPLRDIVVTWYFRENDKVISAAK